MEANLEEMTDSGPRGTGRRKARCTEQLHMGSEGEDMFGMSHGGQSH